MRNINVPPIKVDVTIPVAPSTHFDMYSWVRVYGNDIVKSDIWLLRSLPINTDAMRAPKMTNKKMTPPDGMSPFRPPRYPYPDPSPKKSSGTISFTSPVTISGKSLGFCLISRICCSYAYISVHTGTVKATIPKKTSKIQSRDTCFQSFFNNTLDGMSFSS